MKLIYKMHLVLFLFGISYTAQGQQSDEKPIRPFQMSIFPALSTEGINALNYRYQVSLNLFAGITGGTEGVEFGGFANINRGRMHGLQMAGFANIISGEVEGIQGAGFVNVVSGSYSGIGLGGFANVVGGNSQGIFSAGFGNFHGGNLEGLQLSGFMNAASNVQGLQAAGFMNFASNLQGFQAAGFMNMARDLQGFQVAGFMNMARDLQGFQAAGFLNIAREVEGFQVGFVNVADTISGIPFGFLSIVRRGGYRSIDLAASDALFINASFKIGVPRFYNIFSFGARPFSDNNLSGFGYGIGTGIDLSDASALHIEAHTTWLSSFENWRDMNVNQLNELRFIFNYNTAGRLNVFAGPVFYTQVIQEDPITGIEGLSVAPYTLFTHTRGDHHFQWWPGFRAGINLLLN